MAMKKNNREKDNAKKPRSSKTAAASSATKPPSTFRRLIDLDTAWSLHIHTICHPIIPRSALKALEISGDGRFWIPIPVALLLATPPPLRSIPLLLLLGFLLDLLLVGSLKYLVRRPRPSYNAGMHLTVAVDHWSFPSGHSSRVCFIAAFLYLSSASLAEEFQRLGSPQIPLSAVLLWSASTCMSRVLLGRHFVFDVIAGACLGLFEAVVVFRIGKFMHQMDYFYPVI